MTLKKLAKLFEKYTDDGEYLEFERIDNPKSKRPDLHAFILLDSLVPSNRDIVSCAEHDEFWLEVSPEDVAEVATPEQILELVRCGVCYDDNAESFSFNV